MNNVQSGPEVSTGYEEIFQCSCSVYEPTVKDISILGANTSKNIVTIGIRNSGSEYVPKNNHLFKVLTGFFKDNIFEIKHIGPYKDNRNYIKIIGEGVN
ncbi:hypothetical protein BVH56_05535 [Abyssicoccus albus]|nr:hypothetical protein BVH56_05535 [Abyssicoccus albus]